jgi:putative transposase
MARPLRIEFAGALYHVTSRGDGRDDLYLDDQDRRRFLDILSAVRERFNWVVVEKDSYLLELSRYIVLNPVRAQIMSLSNKYEE